MALGDNGSGNIACGSFTTDGNQDATISLGWEPQYVMTKRTDDVSSWAIFDNIRGITADNDLGTGYDAVLYADLSQAETSANQFIELTPTGFATRGGLGGSRDFIYMAIRRPMKTPESSDEVFCYRY